LSDGTRVTHRSVRTQKLDQDRPQISHPEKDFLEQADLDSSRQIPDQQESTLLDGAAHLANLQAATSRRTR
jgi:hypothetical protein